MKFLKGMATRWSRLGDAGNKAQFRPSIACMPGDLVAGPAGVGTMYSFHIQMCCSRVRFAQGPFSDQYATKDGHPHHEGQTAIQRRSVSSPWPLDLTPHSIRMLEAEVGDICQHSIERLKRRQADKPCKSLRLLPQRRVQSFYRQRRHLV